METKDDIIDAVEASTFIDEVERSEFFSVSVDGSDHIHSIDVSIMYEFDEIKLAESDEEAYNIYTNDLITSDDICFTFKELVEAEPEDGALVVTKLFDNGEIREYTLRFYKSVFIAR